MQKSNCAVRAFVLVASLALTGCAADTGETVRPYGLCVHKMHIAEDRAAAFPVMTAHGVGYVRCDFNWTWIEPQKGEWDFTAFDALMDDAERHGIKVLPILHHGAEWTRPLMDHLDDWRLYVRKCIERYGSRIEAVEIWNEANIHAFPGPIEDYAKVLKIASEEIRRIAPQVKITTSGWAGVPLGQIEYLYRHVGRDAFDIVNFHHYSFGEQPNGEIEDVNFTYWLDRLRELMTKYGDRDKPLWLTECGYPTHDPSLVLHNIFKVQLPIFDPDRRNWRVRMVMLGTETENQVEGYARLMKEELPDGSDFKFVRANRLVEKLREGDIDVIILPFHEKMPAGCADELLAFIRQGGVVAQFGEGAMSYLIPQGPDGVCRFTGGNPNGQSTRRRFGFDVLANYADSSVPGRQTAITNATSGAMGTEGVTVGMWTMRAGIPCSRWMTPVESKDLPGLEFTPLMTYRDKQGKVWTAAARLRLPGRKAGGLIISCGEEREENLYPANYARQARVLPRQYLFCQMLGCEEIFWYVYKTWEGTTDARRFNREPFFGLVRPKTEEPKPALVALKTLVAVRPVGSRTRPGLWRDEKAGLYFPQWTLPDGTAAGALWLRARRICEPPRGERRVMFDSDRMSFTDHLGRDITDSVRHLGKGCYALPLSEAVIYFKGGRFVSPAEEILHQHAGAAHPRLFDIPNEVDGRLERVILAAADSHLDQPPIERKFDESGRRILRQAGKVRARVIALASAYRLTKDVRYAEAAKREMLAGAAWTDWNPHHWLDTATMLEALSIGVDWLYDALDDETRATLRKACVDKGLRTIHEFEAETQHWRVGDNNWNTSCWGAVVMTVLAFNGELPDWCSSLFSEAIEALPRPLRLMAPKGAYAEGPSYWGSIIGHLLVIDALESALGTSFGLADFPGLRETVDYRAWMEGTSGYLFNYSDAGSETPSVMRKFCLAQLWLAKRFDRHDSAVFDRAELERLLDGDATAAYGKLGVIPLLVSSWGVTAPADADLKGPERPLDWYSGGTQPLVVMRSDKSGGAAYLGVKGGKSAASHGHDDSGTFVFDDAGVRWAVDLGSNPYQAIENTKINLWDNWAVNPTRWQVLRLSNRGHNVVTIDDEPFYNYGFADFTKRDFAEKSATATLDLSQTYLRQAKRATRTFTLDRVSHKLTIADDLTGLRPGARVTWRMYTPAGATLAPEGVILKQSGRAKSLRMDGSVAGAWRIRAANDLRNDWDAMLDGLTVVEYVLTVPEDGCLELTAILSSAGASAAENPYGVCAHVSFDSEYRVLEETCRTAADIGFGGLRTDFRADEIAPEAGRFAFERYDRILDCAEKHGLQILPMLGYSVPWAKPARLNLEKMWLPFVSNVVARYHGRLPVVEIWNEENSGLWGETPNAADYLPLLNRSYAMVKSVNPSVKVAIGGLSGVAIPYLRQIYEGGGKDSFDIMNVHPYSFPRPPEGDLDRRLDELRALMAEFGDAEKEIWMTEFGWPTPEAGLDVPGLMRSGIRTALPDVAYPRVAYLDMGERGDVNPKGVLASLRQELPEAQAVVSVSVSNVLSAADLRTQHDVLVMPFAEVFPDEALDVLDRFVTEGGVLVDFGCMPFSKLGRERFRIETKSIWVDKRYPRAQSFADADRQVAGFSFPKYPRAAYTFFTDGWLKPGDLFCPLVKRVKGDVDVVPAAIYRFADRKGAILVSGYLDQNVVVASEDQQAEYAVRANLIAFAKGVKRTFWYELASAERAGRDPESHFGLCSRTLCPKKSARAYAEFIRMRPAGSVQLSGLVRSKDGTRFATRWRRPDGTVVLASWALDRPVCYKECR